jgi:hypothetical protein
MRRLAWVVLLSACGGSRHIVAACVSSVVEAATIGNTVTLSYPANNPPGP